MTFYTLLQAKIEKLKLKVEALEVERDNLKESEADLDAKVTIIKQFVEGQVFDEVYSLGDSPNSPA